MQGCAGAMVYNSIKKKLVTRERDGKKREPTATHGGREGDDRSKTNLRDSYRKRDPGSLTENAGNRENL